MPDLQITPIELLATYGHGTLIQLPNFADGQPFIAKIKRPSMLAMIKDGKIPNSLLNSAQSLFTGANVSKTNDASAMENLFDVLDLVCESSFVEPTWKQLKDAGVQLTDDQYMAIFNYTQNGVKALDSFRTE